MGARSRSSLRGSGHRLGHLDAQATVDVAGNAELAQEAAVSRALATTTAPPSIFRRVLEGDPGTEPCRSARHADLLVVGATHKNIVKRFASWLCESLLPSVRSRVLQ